MVHVNRTTCCVPAAGGVQLPERAGGDLAASRAAREAAGAAAAVQGEGVLRRGHVLRPHHPRACWAGVGRAGWWVGGVGGRGRWRRVEFGAWCVGVDLDGVVGRAEMGR